VTQHLDRQKEEIWFIYSLTIPVLYIHQMLSFWGRHKNLGKGVAQKSLHAAHWNGTSKLLPHNTESRLSVSLQMWTRSVYNRHQKTVIQHTAQTLSKE
jgi:hypothetical protein